MKEEKVRTTIILKKLRQILLSEKNKESNCISLYNVSQLVRKENIKYKEDINSTKKHLERTIPIKFHMFMELYYCCFDYKQNELKLYFMNRATGDTPLSTSEHYEPSDEDNAYRVVFTKNSDGNLCIKEDKFDIGNIILEKSENNLLKLYNKYEQYRYFNVQKSQEIRPVNFNGLVNIDYSGLALSLDSNWSVYNSLQRTSEKTYYYSDDYWFIGDDKIEKEIKGMENEFFKRIFIKIDDCPDWSKDTLFETRKNELIRENIKNKVLKLTPFGNNK